jgi:pyruvate dehydrogenase E2 component (dihydrolipoamide acetyltransferase)
VPVEFTMPKLGLTMEEGTILEWLVPDGTEITDGTPVVLVETDKVETEVNVSATGRLVQTGAVGDTFACGERIGWLLAPGEDPPAAPSPSPSPAAPKTVDQAALVDVSGSSPAGVSTKAHNVDRSVAATAPDGRLLASPNARRVASEAGVDIGTIRGTGPGGRIVSEDVEEAIAAGTASAPRPASAPTGAPAPLRPDGTVAASVAGRNLADLLGIDLATVAPDPVERRVTRDAVALHVRSLLGGGASPAAPAPAAPSAEPLAPASQPPTRVVPMKGMRGTIAKRMHGALQSMAQLTLFMDADLDAVVADRSTRAASGAAPGYTDYVIAAAARALREHPIVNSQVTDEGIAVLPDIHVGMAVAVEDGLMVPVVRHADRLDLATLSTETTRLAEATRTKTIGLDDLEGGTFSVTALGMFGVDGFTPVINPPNTAILGVGRLRDDLVLVDGQIATRKRLTLSLTWDHRVFDGAPAAEFCRTIVRALADPTDW